MVEVASVSFFAAFFGGIVMTLFPCTYPMVIGYIALIVGGQRTSVSRALVSTFWFFVGFAAVYALYGSVAGLFGQFSGAVFFVNTLKPFFVAVGGVFFLVIGLLLLRVISLPERLKRSRFTAVPQAVSPKTRWGASLIGAIFAVGWSPCVGPMLGGILLLAATTGSVLTGMALLIVFSFGMMIPLALLAAIYVKSIRLLKVVERIAPFAQSVGGALFILIGLFFLIGGFSILPYPSFLNGLEQFI